MKNLMTVSAALMMTTTVATAGGLDRSGQSVSAIFQDGNYAELSFGKVMADVSGGFTSTTGVGDIEFDSGNVAEDYTQLSFAVKTQINEQLSVALIVDQPFGANVNYSDGSVGPEESVAIIEALTGTTLGYPVEGSNAEFRSQAFTALARYKLDDKWSLHGGLRYVTIDADAEVVTSAGLYQASYAEASDTQIVLGGAYERPDIALRVALTYASEMEFSHDTTVTGVPEGVATPTEYIMPQSWNLEFQTGIAPKTLLMGGARWVEWSKTNIDSFAYPGNPIVAFEDDTIAYSIGLGRQLTDQFSASVMLGYEAEQDGIASNLAPTDGNTSITIGGRYNVGNGLTVSGGYRMIWVGDAETDLNGIETSFADNTAKGFGLTVGYSF